MDSRSFSVRPPGIVHVLATECWICPAFDAATTPVAQQPQRRQYIAIWDTGATGSVITSRVAQECGLKPTGVVHSHGVNGSAIVDTFLVNILLPNQVQVQAVTVSSAPTLGGADVIIGMDIITTGDFAITNRDGKTNFSFRVPSMVTIDFVTEHEQRLSGKKPSHGGSSGGKKDRKKRPPKTYGKNKHKRR